MDLENYADVKESTFRMPAKGVYTVQAPETFPQEAFGATRAGHLRVTIDPTIVGPTNENFKLRYTSVSAKTFKRGQETVSLLGDYLRACGVRAKLETPQQLADAVEATAGRIYQIKLDWRAYNKDTQYTVEGMEKFPSDGKGGYLPWIEDPNAKDENGKPVRLRANLFIPFGGFIPASA